MGNWFAHADSMALPRPHGQSRRAGMPILIWNDLRQQVLLHIFCNFISSALQEISVQAASTMNQSDIRGLSRRIGTEPTLIFFVDSYAFYGRESDK